jgi:hypothetical protein
MQSQYEHLIEQRCVVERAQHVIFGKKEPKSKIEEFFNGDTSALSSQTERQLIKSDPTESNR